MNIEQIQEMKQDLEKMIAKSHKIEGAIEEVTKQLNEKYDGSNWGDAKTLLRKMEEKEQKLKEELEDMMEKFKKKWGDKING